MIERAKGDFYQGKHGVKDETDDGVLLFILPQID